MLKTMKKFLQDESGASLIEYVLLAALIGVAAYLGMKAVGTESQTQLDSAATKMKG